MKDVMKRFVVLRLILVQASTSEQLPVADTQTILLSVTKWGTSRAENILLQTTALLLTHTTTSLRLREVLWLLRLPTARPDTTYSRKYRFFIFYHMWLSIPNLTWKVNRMQLLLLLLWQMDASPGFQLSDKISTATTQEYYSVGVFWP